MMVASRNGPKGAQRPLRPRRPDVAAGVPSEVGISGPRRADCARAVVVEQRTRPHSPRRSAPSTPRISIMPRPVGAAIPPPLGYALAGLDPSNADITGSIRERILGERAPLVPRPRLSRPGDRPPAARATTADRAARTIARRARSRADRRASRRPIGPSATPLSPQDRSSASRSRRRAAPCAIDAAPVAAERPRRVEPAAGRARQPAIDVARAVPAVAHPALRRSRRERGAPRRAIGDEPRLCVGGRRTRRCARRGSISASIRWGRSSAPSSLGAGRGADSRGCRSRGQSRARPAIAGGEPISSSRRCRRRKRGHPSQRVRTPDARSSAPTCRRRRLRSGGVSRAARRSRPRARSPAPTSGR